MNTLPIKLAARRERPRTRTRTRTPGSVARRGLRVAVAAMILAASVALGFFHDMFRAVEAQLASWMLSPIAERQIPASLDNFFVWVGPETLIALKVTIECTALIIALPLTAVAAVLLATTRVQWWRVGVGLSAMWAIVMIVNTFRLALIGWATQTWGMSPGYDISHTYVGSIVGIAGFVAGFAALFLVLGIRRSRAARTR